MHQYKEIETITQLLGLLAEPKTIAHHVFQNIDFTELADLAERSNFTDCMFLGCTLPHELEEALAKDNFIFPKLDAPYNVYRSYVYTPRSLYEGFDPDKPETQATSYDGVVYAHYRATGQTSTNVKETLARYLHDHSMIDNIHDFLADYHARQIVGIMGGHALLRTDKMYRDVVLLSKRLTELGFIMVSGGGAGAMEATHLGAWMAKRTTADVDEALAMLANAPSWDDEGWLSGAFAVRKRFPQSHFVSLGIPTWLYGHEPATPFATHIAKFFDNSIREDMLLTITRGGLIYAPGSAGTVQEIFQAVVPNHYQTYGYSSPMVFLGEDFWTNEAPVYRLLNHLVEKGYYSPLKISISDDIEAIVATIKDFGFTAS